MFCHTLYTLSTQASHSGHSENTIPIYTHLNAKEKHAVFILRQLLSHSDRIDSKKKKWKFDLISDRWIASDQGQKYEGTQYVQT